MIILIHRDFSREKKKEETKKEMQRALSDKVREGKPRSG